MTTDTPTRDLTRRDFARTGIGVGFAAAVLPVWLLLAPRDYLSTFMKIGTVIALGLAVQHQPQRAKLGHDERVALDQRHVQHAQPRPPCEQENFQNQQRHQPTALRIGQRQCLHWPK